MDALDQGFQLDGLRVIPETGELSGPGGRVKLDPKVMSVLVLMARHPHEVIAREALLAQLWPGVVVTDDALTRCFYELRRHLSQAGGDERFRDLIETLPKRGYRLNAEVKAVAPTPELTEFPAPEPAPRRNGRLVAIAAAVLLAVAAGIYAWWWSDRTRAPAGTDDVHAIAVLPFLDMSAEQDQGFFSDGVTEEILNRLSQAENLRVISRTSSFALRGETLDVPQIGARLNVNYVLEGSVRKADGRVRITAQLIDVSTNSHLWSETYDRGLGDLFAVQDEIAASVASALQATLGGSSVQARAPASLEAYEQFLQGQFAYHRRLPGDIERSAEYFERAVVIDPTFARAWAALAGASNLLAHGPSGLDPAWREKQENAALKAVELDPNLAVAQARLAQYYWYTGQGARGMRHFEKAVALDPDDPLVLSFAATHAREVGDLDRAVELWRRAVAQDPLSPITRGNYSALLLQDGRLEEAHAQLLKLFELNPDAGPESRAELVRILTLLKRYDEAQAQIDLLPEGPYRNFALALQHQAPGHREEADAALRALRDVAAGSQLSIRLAEVYAFRDMDDAAIETLAQSRATLERGKPSDLYRLYFFLDDVNGSYMLGPLHDDPRWAALVAQPG
jgi:TolB-like protein/DNA-binding winged helix-turn-helix (wHTH) protein